MIGTLMTQDPRMTIHVMHGESESVLNAQGGALTSHCQLNMRAGLDLAQAYSSSAFGFKNTRFILRAIAPRGPRKYKASIIAVIKEVLLEGALANEKAGCVLIVTPGSNMTSIDPRGDLSMTHHPAKVSPFTLRVPPSVYKAHPPKSMPISRVAERILGRYGYLALGLSRRKCRHKFAPKRRVRQVACYAGTKAGVMAVIKEILPLVLSPNLPEISKASMRPITIMPNWRL